MHFKGVWIPVDLIDLQISWTKRILLAEISQLEMLNLGCVASNSHFAGKLNITKQGVSKALSELAEDGYIVIDNAKTKRNFGRKITINYSKSAINYSKSAINYSVQSKESNSINNSINNTNGEISPEIVKNDFLFFIQEVRRYFTTYKINTYKSKINSSVAKEYFNETDNCSEIAEQYAKYVKLNKNMAVRLDKFLIAYKEGNVEDINYGSDKQHKSITKKQPQIGSFGYAMENGLDPLTMKPYSDANAIDVEVE